MKREVRETISVEGPALSCGEAVLASYIPLSPMARSVRSVSFE